MAKFYVVGVNKYDAKEEKFDVVLRLEEAFDNPYTDIRLRVDASELPKWQEKVGTYSKDFEIEF